MSGRILARPGHKQNGILDPTASVSFIFSYFIFEYPGCVSVQGLSQFFSLWRQASSEV
jgi:hypothetical protein